MADQSLKINIGTSYDNSGMSRALRSVGGFSKDIGKVTGSIGRATAAIGQLGGSLDGLGGKASQTIGQLTSALGAIATGGTIGIIAGGIAGWATIFKSLKGETSKTKDESDNLKSSIDALAKSYNTVKDNATQAITANNQLAASIANVASALSNLKAAQGNTATIALGAQNARNVANAPDDEKGIVAAQGAVEMAKLKGEQGMEKTDIALQAASEKVGIYKKNLDEANRQLSQFTETELQLKSTLSDAEEQFKGAVEAGVKGKDLQKYSSAVNNARDALDEFMESTKSGEEARKAVRDADQELLKATLELRTAEQNEANAKAQATADVEAAEQKLYDEEEKARAESVKATWAAVTVEKERNDKMRDEAQSEKKLKEAIDKDKTLQDELNAATQNLKNAQDEYAAACRNAANAANNATWQGWAENNGIPSDQITGNGINGQNRYMPRNNATLNDAGYNARVQAGYERNAQSQGYGLSARDRDFKNDVEGKLASGQDVSRADMQRYKGILDKDPEYQKRKAQEAADKAAEKAKAAQEKKDLAEEKMQTNVEEIKKMMEKLGLK